MSMLSEAEFSIEVVTFFRNKVIEVGWQKVVEVQERVKILKDLTIGKDRDHNWKLVAGFQQQDIVFFNPADQIKMSDFRSEVIRIDKYDRSERTPITVPLIVCELKMGHALNTHTMITYASISTQLKSIFPHCAYFFIMDSNKERGLKPETVLRHTKGFDRVFLDWEQEKEKVWRDIQAYFKYLAELKLIELPDGLK